MEAQRTAGARRQSEQAARGAARQQAEEAKRTAFYEADYRWKGFWQDLRERGQVFLETHAALHAPSVARLQRQADRAGQALMAAMKVAETHPAGSAARTQAMTSVNRARDRYTSHVDRFFSTLATTSRAMQDEYFRLSEQRGKPSASEIQAARRRLASRAIGFTVEALPDGHFRLSMRGQEVNARMTARDLVALQQAYYPSPRRAAS